MEECLLKYFILNNEIKSSCDYKPELYAHQPAVYEVLRVINRKPLFLEEHIERFYQSLYLSNLQANVSVMELINSIKALIEYNQLQQGNIRFQYALNKQNKAEFLAKIIPAYYPTASEFENGIRVISIEATRENPNVKQSNLTTREKANNILSGNDIFEVLLVNSQGFVTEGSRSNVFFVSGNKLITPPLSDVLAGVTRSKIIELSLKHKIAVDERQVRIAKQIEFDAAFLSGTSIKILPINQLNEITLQTSNPIIQKLQKLFDNFIHSHIEQFAW